MRSLFVALKRISKLLLGAEFDHTLHNQAYMSKRAYDVLMHRGGQSRVCTSYAINSSQFVQPHCYILRGAVRLFYKHKHVVTFWN